MPIIKSKTITASGYSRGPMQFHHVLKDDGKWHVKYRQDYLLLGEDGKPVNGLQDDYVVEGEISDADLQRLLPDVWNALAFLYGWFDNEIKKQEGIQ